MGIDADILDPWALDVSVDQVLTVDNTEVTLTYGVKYVARPDNLTLGAGLLLMGALGPKAVPLLYELGRLPGQATNPVPIR